MRYVLFRKELTASEKALFVYLCYFGYLFNRTTGQITFPCNLSDMFKGI